MGIKESIQSQHAGIFRISWADRGIMFKNSNACTLSLKRSTTQSFQLWDRICERYSSVATPSRALAGWIKRHQLDVIAYIREENEIFKAKLKGKRIQLTDDERRRLAVKGKTLGRAGVTGVLAHATRTRRDAGDNHMSLPRAAPLMPG